MTPSVLDQPGIDDSGNEPTQPSTADWGTNNRDAPDSIKNAILAAVRDAQGQEKFLRKSEILQDAELRFYDMEVQHIYRNNQDGWSIASPGGSYVFQGAEESFGEYIDDYNIFSAFALIQQAKLSENMPGIDFQPVDPNQSDDIEAANAAEGMRHDFDRNNDIKELQKEIIYHFQMGGRAVIWTRTDDSPEKFGTSKDGKPRRTGTASVYGCIEAKVPIFAKKRKDFWYCLLYDDPDIKSAKTDYPWIADKITAGRGCLAENSYERLARLQILQGSQGNRQAFQIGDSIAHLVGRGQCFLRLSAFQSMNEAYVDPDGAEESIEDDNGPRPIQVKEKIAQVFPDGIHACVVGDEYAEAVNKSMDDAISIGHAFIGKGQNRRPIMKSMVVVQDRFNSSMNYVAETNDFCVPSTWVSCDPQEYAAIKKQKAQPGAFRNLKQLPTGVTSVANAVYSEEGHDIPESFQKYIEMLYTSLPQFQLSLPPSAWGQAMQDQKTASGYQLAAAQAMGIQGTFWTSMTHMMASMYYHNCLSIMNDSEYPEQITIPGEGGKNTIVRKASLTKGNFRAFPDTDSGFPETTAAKRATLERVVTMLGATPIAAQIMGSPDNVAFMVREEGLTELVIPEAEARNKQEREIETLLDGSPRLAPEIVQLMQGSPGDPMAGIPPSSGADVPTLMAAIKAMIAQGEANVQQQMITNAAMGIAAQATGGAAPPPPAPFDPASVARSSVPVWESDYHVWEAKKCRDWLSSDERNTEETIGRPSANPEDMGANKPNVAGILNVVLHWQEHLAMAALEAPPVSGPLPAQNMPPPPPGGVTPAVAAPGAPTAAVM